MSSNNYIQELPGVDLNDDDLYIHIKTSTINKHPLSGIMTISIFRCKLSDIYLVKYAYAANNGIFYVKKYKMFDTTKLAFDYAFQDALEYFKQNEKNQ